MNTEEQNRLVAEIDRGETWLAEVMEQSPAPECGVLERTKHRVRIAVHEEALDLPQTPSPSPVVVDRVKRSIRVELARAGAGASGASGAARGAGAGAGAAATGWWWRHRAGLSVLAAAAALAFAVVPSLWTGRDAGRAVAVDAFGDFVDALADAAGEEFEQELSHLRWEVDEFADLFVPADYAVAEPDIEELGDELDRLMTDSTAAFDA